MPARNLLVIGVMLGCGCGVAVAQKVGLPAPDIKNENRNEQQRSEEFTEFLVSEIRGRIGVLFFFRSTDPESGEVAPTLNQINEKYRGQGVRVFGFTPENKEKGEEFAKAKEISFTWHWGNASAAVYDVVSYPYVFIIDPSGVITWKGHPLDELERRIKEQIVRTPPIGVDESALNAKLERAESYKSQGEFGKANTLAAQVRLITEEGNAAHEKAKTLQESLLESAKKWLEEAREAYRNKEYDKAVRIVAEVNVRFATDKKEGPEADLLAESDTEIGRLRGDIETKAMISRAIDNARGELKNDEAAELERMRDYAAAMRLYRSVIEEYPKLAAGKAAKEALERLTTDPKLQAEISRIRAAERAQRLFDIAERYARVEMYDVAREQYQKIVKDYPREPVAQRAREALRSLPESKTESKPKD